MSRRRKRDVTDDEAALWRQAIADAAPLPGRRTLARPHHRTPEPRPRPRHEDVPSLAPAGKAPAMDPIDRATYARLKKGRLPIDARIDLHGMTAAAAQRNLTAFLRSSQALGRRAVLVITGRGLDPENVGRGVLKRETPGWLAALPDVVAGYGEADRRHGGAGALYVRIRRKDKAGRK